MPDDKRKQATRIAAGVLKAALADVLGAVEAKNLIPILANVLIEAGEGKIVLVGTNLDIMVSRTCASADRDGPGSADWIASIRPFTVTVPAKPLAAILAEMAAEAMVVLELVDDGTRLTVSAGRARFKLHTLPAAEFPLLVNTGMPHGFDLGCGALADALAAVEHAISSEETRYYLNGIYVHPAQLEGEPQWLVLAATDGNRLARLRLAPPDGAASFPAAIWPRGAVALLDKLLRTAAKTEEKDQPAPEVLVEANEGGTMLRFTMDAADGGEITLLTKAIDGTFPDYVRVIPHDPPRSLVVDRIALAQAVKRVGVLSPAASRAVKVEIGPDRIELVVHQADLGEAREEVPCVFEGEALAIGFNGQFAREGLLALASDEVSLAFTDAGSPVLLRAAQTGAGDGVDPARLVQVLMPMRVG